MTTNFSKAKIANHPIHPMLIAFPVTFYTSTFVGFIVYAVTNDPFWRSASLWANVAGVVMALVAAIPGTIDWAAGIPRKTEAKTTGLKHMALNVTALVLFAGNLVVQGLPWTTRTPLPFATSALLITGAGVLLTLIAGSLGWKLVQTHHVGIQLEDEEAAAGGVIRSGTSEPRVTTRPATT